MLLTLCNEWLDHLIIITAANIFNDVRDGVAKIQDNLEIHKKIAFCLYSSLGRVKCRDTVTGIWKYFVPTSVFLKNSRKEFLQN